MSHSLRALVRICVVASFAVFGCGGEDGDPVDSGTGTPTASFTMTPDCTSSSATQVTFSSTSTDPDQQLLSCSWVFGSGNPGASTQCTVEGVTFPNVAPYDITLTVEDPDGHTDVASGTIEPC